MRVSLLLLIFSFSLAFAVPWQSGQKQNQSAEHSQIGSNKSNNNTRDLPPAQQAANPQTQKIAEGQQAQPYPRPQSWLSHGEWVMSLLTATYILVTALTLFSIKRQGDLMQRQGELMEKQIEAMNDTAIRQLRAYVCLSSAIIKFTRPDAPEVTIQMKNCGQTPALEVRQWIHMWIEDWPLKVNLPEPPPDFQMSTAVLPPGGTHIMSRTKIPPVSSEEIKLLGTAQGTIYIYGKVLYKDVFGKERYTQYRLMHGGRERGETWSDKGVLCGMMSPDIGGNEGS